MLKDKVDESSKGSQSTAASDVVICLHTTDTQTHNMPRVRPIKKKENTENQQKQWDHTVISVLVFSQDKN